ncbi:unnamed protein product [Trichogramma brassicae]|uniref:Uncharacterized protein n=1 Tax=Trichogramma brassicae TaxID=86971 RepID=A0A6H5IET0_9HYME|nr:unnamed protein product [Trichogramma brassicae]
MACSIISAILVALTQEPTRNVTVATPCTPPVSLSPRSGPTLSIHDAPDERMLVADQGPASYRERTGHEITSVSWTRLASQRGRRRVRSGDSVYCNSAPPNAPETEKIRERERKAI